MEYYVYVLFSPAFNKIYIGYSSNVEGRLLSHNVYAKKGWTTRFRPWTIVYTEGFQTQKQ